MEVTLDELRENGVDIDMAVLSNHIHQCLKQSKTMYEQMAILPVSVLEIFEEMNVNNFGRAMAFLTLRFCVERLRGRDALRCTFSGCSFEGHGPCSV